MSKLRRRDCPPEWSTARWLRWRFAWWLPTRDELATTRTDLRALLAGYCNHRPATGNLDVDRGGYDHWRCALRRHHHGPHRTGNYTWSDDRRTDFAPMDRAPRPYAPDLGGSWSWRMRRRAWHARVDRRRRAARRG